MILISRVVTGFMLSLFLLNSSLWAQLTDAQARDHIIRLYGRVSGLPPTAAQVAELLPSMKNGNPAPTVFAAMEEDSFYSLSLLRMFSPYSNVEGAIDERLNDFTATVIGLVRDNEDMRNMIAGDLLYIANPALQEYRITITPPLRTAARPNCPASPRTEVSQYRSPSDPDYDPRWDPYEVSINARGTRPAIPACVPDAMTGECFSVDAQGDPLDPRPVNADPGISSAPQAFPASSYPLAREQAFGSDTNVTWAYCHDRGGRYNNETTNGIDAGRVRPLLQRDAEFNIYGQGDVGEDHYDQLQKLSNWVEQLAPISQSSLYAMLSDFQRVQSDDVSGVITSRQGTSTYFSAGTNRRLVSEVFRNFLGTTMEQAHDSSADPSFVGQDIERNAQVANCYGCHAMLDGGRQAFLRFDYNTNQRRFSYSTSFGQLGGGKLVRGCTNPNNPSTCTAPNAFDFRDLPVDQQNIWFIPFTTGRNANMGWRTPSGLSDIRNGQGGRNFMKVLAETEAYSNKLALTSFKSICLREPTPRERVLIQDKARDFERGISGYEAQGANGRYNFRALMAHSADLCFGKVEE